MAKANKIKAYLVGVGPGDEGLITQAALDCIHQADVIIYDNLISKSLLRYKKAKTKLVYVGKSPGKHTIAQLEINKLIVAQAKANKIVVRLKGGDPFLFGRGAEEALALAKAGILFEVVPGISSGFAACSYAGIPLTQRGISSQVTFVTGHEDPKKNNLSVDWSQLARLKGTLVVLMGMGRISDIMGCLIAGGMNKKTPACVIQWGTLPRQKSAVGTIANIATLTKKNKMVNPAIIVIGDAVNLKKKINWYESKPLFGKKVLITRPLHLAEQFSQRLNKYGAQTITYPLIEIVKQKGINPNILLNKLSGCDWVIFTSGTAVDICFDILGRKNKDARLLNKIKIAALGQGTRDNLERKGIRPDLVPAKFFMEGLLAEFKKINVKGKRIFIPHSKQGRRLLSRGLIKQGALVDELFIYNVRCPHKANKASLMRLLDKENFDVITFTSTSCVHQFMRFLAKYRAFLKKQLFAVIGPITKKTLLGYGYKAAIEAKTFTIDGLAEAIANYCQKGN